MNNSRSYISPVSNPCSDDKKASEGNVSLIEAIIDRVTTAHELWDLAQELPKRSGGAIVCTSELTPEQIDIARRRKRLVVRSDGIGFALVYNRKINALKHPDAAAGITGTESVKQDEAQSR